MNPDKLFDYLEGRLPAAERAALEQQLISDKQLQRELAVARKIHAGMRGDSREVLLPPRSDVTERGRKMALRVGTAFIVLMAVNVGIGLWLIARHETKNPNRTLLEKQMRNQITNSLEHAAASFTPGPLGVGEIMVPAATGKLETVADEVVTIATRLAVPLQKVSRTRAGSVFLLTFHQIASRNFARRFCRSWGKHHRGRQPRPLQQRLKPRRKVSLCKLSSNEQNQIGIHRF